MFCGFAIATVSVPPSLRTGTTPKMRAVFASTDCDERRG